MAPRRSHPGVYIEETPSARAPIQGVPTSTAVFVADKQPGAGGSAPDNRPVPVASFSEYRQAFGAVSGASDHLGLAVGAFFRNGGSRAYVARLHDGAAPPAWQDYAEFFERKLARKEDANILLLPGKSLDDQGRPYLDAAIAHCETVSKRMVILDMPAGSQPPSASLVLPVSDFAAVYHPWLHIANPLGDTPPTLLLPPSAFAAGVWAGTDARRGVWKAPAGTDAGLRGVQDLETQIDDAALNVLNPLGINCIRTLPGTGAVLWGSRTLAGANEPEWRYVPVRRLAIFLERSVALGTRWAVFEDNNQALWTSLTQDTEAFLSQQFRSGAFQGEKASEAFFVRCGLGETMTQADIQAGRVVLEFGFAPLKPAEFVVLRVEHRLGQS